MLPCYRMPVRSPERFKPWYSWSVYRVLEPTNGPHEQFRLHYGLIASDSALGDDAVDLLRLVPFGTNDRGIELCVFGQIMLLPDMIPVSLKLRLLDIITGPVGVQHSGETVPMTRHVRCAALSDTSATNKGDDRLFVQDMY